MNCPHPADNRRDCRAISVYNLVVRNIHIVILFNHFNREIIICVYTLRNVFFLGASHSIFSQKYIQPLTFLNPHVIIILIIKIISSKKYIVRLLFESIYRDVGPLPCCVSDYQSDFGRRRMNQGRLENAVAYNSKVMLFTKHFNALTVAPGALIPEGKCWLS